MLFRSFGLAMFAGVVGERWAFPWLSSFSPLNRFGIFQKFNEKTTIINKTEQVIVREDISFSKLAEKVAPSLVKILIVSEKEGILPIRVDQKEKAQTRSGFLITSDGLVMSVADQETANYFLENEQLKFKVLFSEGGVLEANLVAYDLYSDLIFFKIEKSGNWTVPVWGDSSKINNGDRVLICSSEDRSQPKLSVNYIRSKEENFSLLNSPLSFSEKLEGVMFFGSGLAEDESNGGSPVLNSEGEIVGLVGQAQKNGQKLNFILPFKSIEETIDRAIKGQLAKRARLGVYYLSLNRELALKNSLPVEEGALVYSFSGQQGLAVLKNSSADRAGIKIGDIIIAVNDQKITPENSLSKLISQRNAGEEITLKLLRGDKELEVKADLE